MFLTEIGMSIASITFLPLFFSSSDVATWDFRLEVSHILNVFHDEIFLMNFHNIIYNVLFSISVKTQLSMTYPVVHILSDLSCFRFFSHFVCLN